jgi:hypothetical protein
MKSDLSSDVPIAPVEPAIDTNVPGGNANVVRSLNCFGRAIRAILYRVSFIVSKVSLMILRAFVTDFEALDLCNARMPLAEGLLAAGKHTINRRREHRSTLLFAATAAWAACGVPVTSRAATLSEADFQALASRCAPGLAVGTLEGVARTESGLDPLTLHDNGKRCGPDRPDVI